MRIDRYEFPDELLYDRQHNWVRLEDDVVVQGLTAYAWQSAGPVRYVELPRLGRQVVRREHLTTVEAEAGVVRLRAAVSGEIVAVNQRLQQEVGLILEHPYDEGWVLKIRLSLPEEIKRLDRPQEPVFREWFLLNLSGELSRQLGGPEYAVLTLHRDLEQTYNRLETLYEVARAASSSLDLDEVLQAVAQHTAEAFEAKGCSIRLLDEAGLQLRIAAAWGLSERYVQQGTLALRSSPFDQQLLQGPAALVQEVPPSPICPEDELLAQEGIGSILGYPLIVRDQAIGLIRVYSASRQRFGQRETDFLQSIANQVAISIANALAYRELAEIDRAKSQFVLTVTHELRAPVATVQSLLRVITGGYAGDISEQQQELIARAERRTHFLQQLIDDLLDLAAGKSEQLSETPHQLVINPLVKKVLNQLRPIAEGKQQELRVYVPHEQLAVLATQDGIERILVNLVGNAIKYTPEQGRIEVTLDRAEDQACLIVADNGIGIPAQAIPHLFEEFFRAENAKSQERDGTGLGLSIVKSLIDRYGGRIGVESTLGQGSTFTVYLPLLSEPVRLGEKVV
ncbi:MAG: GAF domain-containing protein [Chloroflexia bacterium]|nr:GAF domain-containing protein [Chloroflexia bacterium]